MQLKIVDVSNIKKDCKNKESKRKALGKITYDFTILSRQYSLEFRVVITSV